MHTKQLGTSGLHVPIICLGTMTWGQQNTEAEAHAHLDYAVDERGLTFIDTAEIYPVPPEPHLQGLTETYIGNWLKKRGKRSDLLIATKTGAGAVIQTREVGAIPRYDRKSIREALDGSLQRLQTDYIDLYQIHFPERKANFFGVRGFSHIEEDSLTTPIEETLEALAELVKEGRVRHIGVSNETPWGVMEYLRVAKEKSLPRIVSIQNQYSLTNRTFEIGLAEMVLKENIGMLAYSSLNMGALSGKYLGGSRPEGARFTMFERNEARYNPARAQEAIKRYVQIAKDNGLDPAQMAYAYAASREFISSVIIGATNLDQLKTAIDSAELKLNKEVLEQIEQVHAEFPDATH